MNPLERELMEMKGMNIGRDGVFFVLLIAFFSCVLHTKLCLCRGLEGRRRRDVVGVDCGAARPGEARADVLASCPWPVSVQQRVVPIPGNLRFIRPTPAAPSAYAGAAADADATSAVAR